MWLGLLKGKHSPRRPGDFVEVTFTRNGAASGPVPVDAVVGIPDPTRRRPWDGA